MAEVLVLVEATRDSGVKKVTLELLTLARQIGSPSAVVFGAGGAAVLLPSTQEGKEIAGRLAVKLDNGLLTDAVELTVDGVATQPAFAGQVIVKSRVTKGIPIATLRP